MVPRGKEASLTGRLNQWLFLGALGFLAVAAGVAMPSLLESASGAAREQAIPSKTADWADLPDLGSLVLRLSLGTVVVLGLCALMLWAGKRRQHGVAVAADNTGMRILETLPLGNCCFVHLVQAGTGQALVGMDRTGCKRVIVLPEPLEGDVESSETGADLKVA